MQIGSRLTMSSRHSKSVTLETIVFALVFTETIFTRISTNFGFNPCVKLLSTIPNKNKLNKLNSHYIYSFSTKKHLLLRPKIFLENKKIKNEITRK